MLNVDSEKLLSIFKNIRNVMVYWTASIMTICIKKESGRSLLKKWNRQAASAVDSVSL